jgi:hypothetical protein
MPTGHDQHLVPQMMIKSFAGDDRKLTELIKPELAFGSRRRSPKGILFGKDFYRDHQADLDEELFTPIEQRFALIYPSLADDAHPQVTCGKNGAALIDWIASMLVRTRAYSLMAQVVGRKHSAFGKLLCDLAPALMNNIFRIGWFSELQDILSRPLFQWRVATFPPEETVVLTDFPVFQTSGSAPDGQVAIVPLSKHRVLFGGSEKAVAHWRIPVDDLNAILAGYAERSIFAADRATLERVVQHIRGEKPHSQDWCAAARRPFFGFLDQLKDMKSPDSSGVTQWFKQLKDGYGESILPPNRGMTPAASPITRNRSWRPNSV